MFRPLLDPADIYEICSSWHCSCRAPVDKANQLTANARKTAMISSVAQILERSLSRTQLKRLQPQVMPMHASFDSMSCDRVISKFEMDCFAKTGFSQDRQSL
jgi:hypothetical protein